MSDNIKNEDIEAIEEAQEVTLPKDEKASVDSVEKASDVTKKAPARKGDKTGTKDEPAQQGNVKQKDDGVAESFEDDLNALVESEATLSEGFREKAALIFEAAINSKVAAKVNELEESYEERLSEETESFKAELVEKVDGYLNYVVESWMEENKLAVEAGLRTEIAEGFMTALKDVFVENYIEVPESKVDLVDQLSEQVSELEEKLNKTIKSNIELAEGLAKAKRAAIVESATKDLTVAQAEKLSSLVESIEFDGEESFAKKISTIKESYFPAEKVVVSEDVQEEQGEDDVIASPLINAYVNAIRATAKK